MSVDPKPASRSLAVRIGGPLLSAVTLFGAAADLMGCASVGSTSRVQITGKLDARGRPTEYDPTQAAQDYASCQGWAINQANNSGQGVGRVLTGTLVGAGLGAGAGALGRQAGLGAAVGAAAGLIGGLANAQKTVDRDAEALVDQCLRSARYTTTYRAPQMILQQAPGYFVQPAPVYVPGPTYAVPSY